MRRAKRKLLPVAGIIVAGFVVWGLAGDQLQALAQQAKAMMKASPEAMAKGDAARAAMLDHQKALKAEGVYSCCINPGCAFCSTAGDMCPCAMNLKQGKPVCPECWGGWHVGKGRLPGIDPGDRTQNIKVLPKDMLKMMYDMKAMGLKRASESGATN